MDLEPYMVDQWVFLTQLKEAMRKKEPIVFYYWGPEWAFAVYDLTAIEFPPYNDAQRRYVEKRPKESRITRGWQPAAVYVGYSRKLESKHPRAYRMLKHWFLLKDEVSTLIAEVEDIPGNPKRTRPRWPGPGWKAIPRS